MTDRLKDELASFAGMWRGGYREGDPLEPLSRSSYAQLGYMSVVRATYLRCIKPYIDADTVALEIGGGGGAWTKSMLEAGEIWVLDAMSAEHNRFWEHVGRRPGLHYVRVEDFECAALPDDRFDYMFSFGCLCHTSFDGIESYARNLFPKLRPGANCFWLVADYEKYNRVVGDLKRYSIWSGAAPAGLRFAPVRRMLEWLTKIDGKPIRLAPDSSDAPAPGRWYDAGVDRTCAMLEAHGYTIVDRDVETSLRDPIIHFRKG